MKTLSERILLFALPVLALACSNQRTEELTAVKKELIAFEKIWETDQKEISTSSADLKEDLKEFALVQKELEQLMEAKKNTSELTARLEMSRSSLDTLRMQMDSLNAFLKTWNAHSKALNELIGQLNEDGIEPAQAREKIADLKAFQQQAEPKLKRIEGEVARYEQKNQELQRFIHHLKR